MINCQYFNDDQISSVINCIAPLSLPSHFFLYPTPKIESALVNLVHSVKNNYE